ncbi:MAG: ATP synthase F1 subunit delta [Actinomycetota bacterium]|nr:ATP synthase F1 subunit delta [Acidimicrobiia bacterium]MDQ3145378.1 ATP synthase F1 subunit delta [Actinomycetota bacterium]
MTHTQTNGDRIEGYANALFEVARVEGAVETVEEELFRFARTLEGNDELRSVLTDQAVPVARRQGIVEDLLGERAHPVTSNLVSFVVGAGRARDLPQIIDRLVARAAGERHRAVAEVRSAIPLDDATRARLAEALGRATGKSVEVKVIVDPSVIGGLVAQVGDTVIDGTVRTRLEQLRERIG